MQNYLQIKKHVKKKKYLKNLKSGDCINIHLYCCETPKFVLVQLLIEGRLTELNGVKLCADTVECHIISKQIHLFLKA